MPSEAPWGGARPRLLLVEDDASVRRSLQLLFQSRGYDVRAYRSGTGLARDPEAMRATCLLADLMLPEGDALDLLGQMRAEGWTGPAVLISGHISQEVRAAAEAQGWDLVFSKPVADAVLTGSIARLISNAPPSAPQAGSAA